MITLKTPYIMNQESRTDRLVFPFLDGDKEKELWFETSGEYAEYLTFERGDAILIGILQYAMITGQDIVSEIPITAELLRNLEMMYIPALASNSEIYERIHIKAPQAKNIKEEISSCTAAVATGCSCGVDSFYTIANNINNPYEGFRLTHLFVTDVGAFSDTFEDIAAEAVYAETVRKAGAVAKELGLKLIASKSNYFEFFDQNFLYTCTLANMFAIFCLQKLFKVFYFSSSVQFQHFELDNVTDIPSQHYDLLTTFCFSSAFFRILPEGSQVTRFEKTALIKDFPPAHTYLQVCSKTIENCGECHKCKRTLLDLDANDALENFKQVFSLQKYEKNKKTFYQELLSQPESEFTRQAKQIIAKRTDSNASSVKKTGWSKKDEKTFFTLADGTLAKGNFFQLNTQWYYFDADGIMATGLKDINGINYYFSYDGGLKTGFHLVNGKPYHFELDGKGSPRGWLKTSKLSDGGGYFCVENGQLAVGDTEINGKIYHFDEHGRLLTDETPYADS